jgi:uncharacterized membrane protein (UPF0127 family)
VPRHSFLSGILGNSASRYTFHNARTGGLLASRVELAVDSASRRRGLLGRDSFDEGSALIIAPCNSIHTFFMRFDIDVVFVAKDGRVLKTCAAIPRRRIAFSLGAFAAVELPAGTLAKVETKAGDTVELSPSDGSAQRPSRRSRYEIQAYCADAGLGCQLHLTAGRTLSIA